MTWTRELVVEETVAWYKTHNASPNQVVSNINKMLAPTAEDLDKKRKASLLSSATRNHWEISDLYAIVTQRLAAESAEGYSAIVNVNFKQQWDAGKVIDAMVDWYNDQNVSPQTVVRRMTAVSTPTVEQLRLKSYASGLAHAVRRYFPKRVDELMILVEARQALAAPQMA